MMKRILGVFALLSVMGLSASGWKSEATAGAAKAKVENSFRTTNGANSFTETVNEDDADGYQLGAGVEWKLAPNLSLTGEYLYSNLQPGDYVVRVGQGTAPATNPFPPAHSGLKRRSRRFT